MVVVQACVLHALACVCFVCLTGVVCRPAGLALPQPALESIWQGVQGARQDDSAPAGVAGQTCGCCLSEAAFWTWGVLCAVLKLVSGFSRATQQPRTHTYLNFNRHALRRWMLTVHVHSWRRGSSPLASWAALWRRWTSRATREYACVWLGRGMAGSGRV